MSSNQWVRQVHRWLSIAFTVAVIVNIVIIALRQKEYPAWACFPAVVPLAFLQATDLYLLGLPYATDWRSGRRTDEPVSRLR